VVEFPQNRLAKGLMSVAGRVCRRGYALLLSERLAPPPAGLPAGALRITKTGHPQWPTGYFRNGNPLADVNEALGARPKA
jgi:hypothetical protein